MLHSRCLQFTVVLLTVLVLVTGCSGGGGGGGGGGPAGGGGEQAKGFSVVGGPDGSELAGVNSPVTLVFTKALDPDSVTPESVRLVTVADITGQTNTPPGVLAAFTLAVDGTRIVITPTLEFDTDNVSYGFVGDALYEISFPSAGSGNALTSMGGALLANPTKTFFFRTPLEAVDSKPGFPAATAVTVADALGVILPGTITDEDGDGDLLEEVLDLFGADAADVLGSLGGGSAIQPTSPVRDLLFVFNDALIPNSVLNPSDSSSPVIRVLINIPGQFAFQPIVAPASLTFVRQQADLTLVAWRCAFQAYPPGALLIVEVGAEVSDLAGNSKFTLTGSNAPLLSEAVDVQSLEDGTEYEIVEPFADAGGKDDAATSAEWSPPGADVLRPVLGGGRGLDGPLVIDPAATTADPGTTTVPLTALVDFDARRVDLPVVDALGGGVFEPRDWELERLTIPAGWTLGVLTDRDGDGTPDPEEFLVQSPGHPLHGFAAPLRLLVTGLVDIAGAVAVSATDGELLAVPQGSSDPAFATYLAQGGAGGTVPFAAGDGGDGGSVLALGSTGLVTAALVSPSVQAPGLAFDASDGRIFGATGRSASLTADTLVDGDQALTGLWTPGLPGVLDPVIVGLIAGGDLRLQPNLGVGSSAPGGAGANSGSANQAIDENHPTFTVTSIAVDDLLGTTTIQVDGSAGTLLQASKNVSTFPLPAFAPIAAGGDSYLLGPLAGREGADDAGLGRGGQGAEPYVVVNASVIKTAGGGGGGGGSLLAGGSGGSSGPASDPNLNQRALSSGLALDDAAGASGGVGAIRGTGQVIDGTTFDLLTHGAGLDPTDLDATALVGLDLVLNAPADGWRFRVVAASGGIGQAKSVTLAPIDVTDGLIDLLSGPAGVTGPGLMASAVVPYLLVPGLGVGGGGGGGTGVSVTGTLDTDPAALARLTPGAGGGSGGGSLRIETAGQLILRSTASVSADGGAGGTIPSSQIEFAGGGGGGGGQVELAAGETLSIFQGAHVSAAGGAGGGAPGQGLGGAGGAGWLRLETFADDLTLALFDGLTEPTLAEENLGRFVGAPRAVGQSHFAFTGLANPEVDSLLITYEADVTGDGVAETGLTWGFDSTGRDGGAGDFDRPPFRFTFNPTTVDTGGFLDEEAASPTFYEACDLVSGRSGLAHDPDSGALRYLPGRAATIVHCLTGCADLALPELPGVDGFALDLASMAVGRDDELFLLEQATGRIHVVDLISGLPLRTLSLPQILEGGLAYVRDGVDPADDRLVIASNGTDTLVEFAPRDESAADPVTADYAPLGPERVLFVSRDGIRIGLELTGLAHDAASDTLWCVDALAGVLFQVDWAPGFEGESDSALGHPYVGLTQGGVSVLPSALAFDGTDLHLTVATDPDVTSMFSFSPGLLSVSAGEFEGPPLVLPAVPTIPALPERALPIAAGRMYLRFRLALDGLMDDPLHASGGTASFRRVAVDEVAIRLRNAGF